MKKEISKKQLNANRQNSLKGGVKTERGKEKIKYNALKHGLSSKIYDENLEREIIKEYNIEGTLEKILVQNICISRARYERGVELENKLIKHIIKPFKYEKLYKSQEEYENYIIEKQKNNDLFKDILAPIEPDYEIIKVEGEKFEFDIEKIKYLVDILGKYNIQNETRLNKNILGLLNLMKG